MRYAITWAGTIILAMIVASLWSPTPEIVYAPTYTDSVDVRLWEKWDSRSVALDFISPRRPRFSHADTLVVDSVLNYVGNIRFVPGLDFEWGGVVKRWVYVRSAEVAEQTYLHAENCEGSFCWTEEGNIVYYWPRP